MRCSSLLLIAAFFITPSLWAAETKVCERVLVKDAKIKLNANEKVLVCGSDEEGRAWAEIPVAQAEFHMNSILQNLGYLNPRFERQDEFLTVWAGKRTTIKSLQVDGDKGTLNPAKKRKIIDHPLVPEKLNELDSWANSKIRSRGYACPKITVEAHAWDQSVYVKADLGDKKVFGKIIADSLDGLNPDILDRYRPFEPGQPYDVRKTQIMVNRMLADGLFQSAYFTTKCEDATAILNLETSVGKPKILRFGIGASTEETPFTDVTFRNARLDNTASSFTANLKASPRRQSLTLTSQLYWFPGWHRTFWGPRFVAEHEIESSYEQNTAKAGADMGRTWDEGGVRFSGRVGPTINYAKTLEGYGPGDITYTTIDGSLLATNFVYESDMANQYEGWDSSFYYRGQRKGLGSEIAVNRFEVNYKYLWNIGGYSPPLFVLGSRLQGIAVDTDAYDLTQEEFRLPLDERIFLGGDQDLRGFPRQGVNNNGIGFLTVAYVGFELRLIEELPFHLQPFLLWDGAKAGVRRFTLDQAFYTSSGLGLRWVSPFGTLRGSAARGQVHGEDPGSPRYPEQWVYFLSFGQEF